MTFTKNTKTVSPEPEISVTTSFTQLPLAVCSNSTPSTDLPYHRTPAVITTTAVPQHVCAQVISPRYVHVASRRPVMLTYCPNCAREKVHTRTRTKSTGTTWVCVVAGAVIFWPLFWVPLVVKQMKQTNHYCQSCGTKVGRVKPFQ